MTTEPLQPANPVDYLTEYFMISKRPSHWRESDYRTLSEELVDGILERSAYPQMLEALQGSAKIKRPDDEGYLYFIDDQPVEIGRVIDKARAVLTQIESK